MRLSLVMFAVVSLGSATPALGTVEEFTDACLTSSNLNRPVCECCGLKAEDRLSPLAFEFLIATLQKNKTKIEELRPQLSMQEAMDAGMFMVGAPAECANEMPGQ